MSGQTLSDAALCAQLLNAHPHVRYSAVARGQSVVSESRHDLKAASDATSDLFEELLVNPTLLLLARQRGDFDCGGLRHLIVAYGHFNQIVMPLELAAHASVAVEQQADAARIAEQIEALLRDLGVRAGPSR